MLPQVRFGALSLRVSRVCVGTGSSGMGSTSVQGRQSPAEYAEVLVEAFRQGINFWDTADNYGTHPHVAFALQRVPREQVVITTKVYSENAAALDRDVQRSWEELGGSWIDVLLLHEVDSLAELAEKEQCLEALLAWKERGLVKAIGVSTHSIDVLERLVVHPRVDVVFTNYNKANEHMDASRRDYEKALETAYAVGKGVYVHKTLNEGKLAHRYDEMLEWNLTRPFIHSVAMGVTSRAELGKLIEVSSRCLGVRGR